jgi:hypothetical protein
MIDTVRPERAGNDIPKLIEQHLLRLSYCHTSKITKFLRN